MPEIATDIKKDGIKYQGPDQKWYLFKKGTSQEKIEKHFTKQGWVKKQDGWYTQDGQKAKMGVAPSTSVTDTKRVPFGLQPRTLSGLATAGNAALPTAAAGIGEMFGGPIGAGIGGGAGEVVRLLNNRVLYNQEIGNKQIALEAIKEAGLQATLSKAGEVGGKLFFKVLDKIPHAKIIEKIPFLPSEYRQGGKVYKYIEDLFSNLMPSAGEMAKFRAGQETAIDKSLTQLVNGLGHFKGTSADMGEALQAAVRTSEKDAVDSFKKMAAAKGIKSNAELFKTPEYQAYKEMFGNKLMKSIATTESPSLVAGYIRNKTLGSEENVKLLVELLSEKNPKLLGKVRASLMRDTISEALKGSTDPVAKGVFKGGFTGEKFKKVLDNIGEERLKALYGQEGYDNIENFIALTGRIGTSSNGAGRFLNLAFLLPFRNGLSLKAGGKLATTGLVINRMAKVLTSPEGMKLYQKEIEASTKQLPRLANLAREEIKAFNERADKEYELEKEQDEEEYQREKSKQK